MGAKLPLFRIFEILTLGPELVALIDAIKAAAKDGKLEGTEAEAIGKALAALASKVLGIVLPAPGAAV